MLTILLLFSYFVFHRVYKYHVILVENQPHHLIASNTSLGANGQLMKASLHCISKNDIDVYFTFQSLHEGRLKVRNH